MISWHEDRLYFWMNECCVANWQVFGLILGFYKRKQWVSIRVGSINSDILSAKNCYHGFLDGAINDRIYLWIYTCSFALNYTYETIPINYLVILIRFGIKALQKGSSWIICLICFFIEYIHMFICHINILKTSNPPGIGNHRVKFENMFEIEKKCSNWIVF